MEIDALLNVSGKFVFFQPSKSFDLRCYVSDQNVPPFPFLISELIGLFTDCDTVQKILVSSLEDAVVSAVSFFKHYNSIKQQDFIYFCRPLLIFLASLTWKTYESKPTAVTMKTGILNFSPRKTCKMRTRGKYFNDQITSVVF